MANTRMKKVVAMLAVLAMVATLVPAVAFATSNTVEIAKAEFADATEPTVQVLGSLSGDGDVTVLVIRSNASLSGTIPATLDEDAIMYVDQKAATDASATGWTFKLRDTSVTGNYITVFMGGTDVANYVSKELILKASTGVVEMAANEKDYYLDGAQVLNLTGADSAWLDAVSINVYDGETLAGSIDTETGIIALDAAPNEVKTYTIKFEGAGDTYNSVADKTVNVISADGAVIKELDVVPTMNDSGEEAWTITIPADTADVTFTVTVDGDDAAEDVVEGVLTVTRPADDNDPDNVATKTVVVTATAGTATKDWTFTVNEVGVAAAAEVAAENVTVATRANVYGKTGYKLIKVVADIDHESKSIKVGNQTLYYSVDKDAYYGIVTAADVADDEVTAATVANEAEIVDEASAIFYFGKANNPTNPRATTGKVTAGDVAATKKIVLKTSDPEIDTYLAADVNSAEPDGNITAGDVSALKKNVLNATVLPVLE